MTLVTQEQDGQTGIQDRKNDDASGSAKYFDAFP
jgi:hypothetical protein